MTIEICKCAQNDKAVKTSKLKQHLKCVKIDKIVKNYIQKVFRNSHKTQHVYKYAIFGNKQVNYAQTDRFDGVLLNEHFMMQK